jgi:DNA mismatch repair protein MutL
MVDPVYARSSKVPQDLFVNRRPVRNATVFHAVIEGYGSLLAKGHHPTYVLFVDIDPDRIDVNVHPAKREIRFADQEMVYRFVRQTVRHAFSGVERKLVLGMGSEEPVAETASPDTMAERPRSGTLLRPGQTTVSEHSHWPVAAASDSLYVGESPASYANSQGVAIVPFGQVLRTYLVAQVGRELHVIDQHTAHERVLFQRLWRRWMQREMVIQPLLIPESIELTVAQATLLQKHLADLEQLGLALEPFGPSAVLLRGVPAGLGPVDGASLVRELLEDMTEWATTASLDARAQPVFATVACKSAVQAGRTMTLPEVERLVCDWVDEGLMTTCPHGRRTAFRFSSDELDKLFGRTGWS